MKYSYFAKASKYLFFGTLMLFVTKLAFVISAFSGSESERLQSFFSSLTEVAFYGYLILSFIALYNEGSALKRAHEFKAVKRVNLLKKLTVLCILSVFVKALAKAFVKSTSNMGAFGVGVAIVCAFFVCSVSLSFVMFALSVWYFKRDRGEKSLRIFGVIAIAFAAVYFASRYMSVSSEFGVSLLGGAFYEAFCSEDVQNVLCIAQYGADALLFYVTFGYYYRLSEDSSDESSETVEGVRKGESLYNERGYGIDKFDDLYIE